MAKGSDRLFAQDCCVCLHEAAHLVLTYVLSGSVPHSATVEPIKECEGHVLDTAYAYLPSPPKRGSASDKKAFRLTAEARVIGLLAGREAECKAFPFLSKSYGTDGKKARQILENFEPDLKKRRAWYRELHNRVGVELERWWSFIVMVAIILQVKRTLDRDAIDRIVERIDEATGEGTYERLSRREKEG